MMTILFAIRELYLTLADGANEAVAAADLRRRLIAWWWTITHEDLLGEPA